MIAETGSRRGAWRAARLGLLVPPALFWLVVLAALTAAPWLLRDLAEALDTLMWALLAALFGRDLSARFRG